MLPKNPRHLPPAMQNEECGRYLALLNRRRAAFRVKRAFDILLSLCALAALLPLLLLIALLVGLTSQGGALFCQTRVGQNLKRFTILKFRTMRASDNRCALPLTVRDDPRITPLGRFLRKLHLDELPQLINVLKGDMSFVGPRPEVERYVRQYTPRQLATLLIPCGITCTASLVYKDENNLLTASDDPETCYLRDILPVKTEYNLAYLERFSLGEDIKIILQTALSVIGVTPRV